MSEEATVFLKRMRSKLSEDSGDSSPDDKRHPARVSPEYARIKWEMASEVDLLCDRIVREIKAGIADIDCVVGPIAEPMAEQLAKGAVSDVFEAAAEVLKAQIRGRAEPR